MNRSAAITVTAAVALVAGCSSERPATTRAGDAVQHISITTTDDFRFVQATPTVHTGTVRITLTDAGTYPHNLSIPELHVTSGAVSGLPGQRVTTLTATFVAAGHYAFVCTYHSSAGMKGEFVVLKRP